MSFDGEWQRIRAAIRPGMTIRNWTVDHGYLGEDFTIDAVSENAIEIRDPEVHVSKADFAAILPLWPSYLAGASPRSKMSPMTRRSKYVISILHALSAEAEGRAAVSPPWPPRPPRVSRAGNPPAPPHEGRGGW
jgi:hypothetical protein